MRDRVRVGRQCYESVIAAPLTGGQRRTDKDESQPNALNVLPTGTPKGTKATTISRGGAEGAVTARMCSAHSALRVMLHWAGRGAAARASILPQCDHGIET